MHLRYMRSRPGAGSWLALLVVPVLAATALPFVHIRLDAASPAADEVLTASPAQLRLTFSARIEQRYTGVTLLAPDSSDVPLGAVEFVAGSDRESPVAVPQLTQPRVYTVGWRAAGADG